MKRFGLSSRPDCLRHESHVSAIGALRSAPTKTPNVLAKSIAPTSVAQKPLQPKFKAMLLRPLAVQILISSPKNVDRREPFAAIFARL